MTTNSLAKAEANLDFVDMTKYNTVPLDANWYDWIFGNCAEHHLGRLFWRISLSQAYYRSQITAPIQREGNGESRILALADMLAGVGPAPFDPLEMAVKYANKHGIQLYAWFPFNETYFRNAERNLIDPWYAQRLDLFWCNRDRSRVWLGMPCVAEPAVVTRTASIVDELCSYGVDGIFLTPRTHCYRPGMGDRSSYSPDVAPLSQASVHPDEFGFNEPIRQRFAERHGVDICNDAFDADAWHRIKGEFYLEFLQACTAAAHRRGKKLLAGSTPKRVGYIPNLAQGDPAEAALRLYNDWEGWHHQAVVDGIVAIQSRLRIGDPSELNPRDSVCDFSAMATAVPHCPISIFQPIMASCRMTQSTWDHRNSIPETPAMLEDKLRIAGTQGAASIILHELYMMLFVNTEGKDTGIGPRPNMNYWQSLAKWNRR